MASAAAQARTPWPQVEAQAARIRLILAALVFPAPSLLIVHSLSTSLHLLSLHHILAHCRGPPTTAWWLACLWVSPMHMPTSVWQWPCLWVSVFIFMKTIYYNFRNRESAFLSFALIWFGFSHGTQSLVHAKQALCLQAACPVTAMLSSGGSTTTSLSPV